MVLKNIEPRPDVNVVCGNIAIDKLSPSPMHIPRIARVKALKVSPRHET